MTAVRSHGTAAALRPLFSALFDDAAIFPPGELPLEQAVPAHRQHRASGYRDLVGPFVVADSRLGRLGDLVPGRPAGSFEVSLTVPAPDAVGPALATAGGLPALHVVAVEVAVPPGERAEDVVPALDTALLDRPGITCFVELPRDGRREQLVQRLVGTPYLAKFRTGGVRADLYPDDAELAAAVRLTAAAGVPFKATAGLHHALRNTDPVTGFEQHGFLNLLVAADAAVSGAEQADLEAILAERDPHTVAGWTRNLAGSEQARSQFRSFGTCSILEPAEDLTALGLLDLDTPYPKGPH